ncbi:unnamed protein product [Bemisia tabaci]|uniref:MADF domain-containing protein n=1 Tax=Bemisia tabaci TaxID=7038 RepID=A0A9P0ALN5_BEMTA|nr:unnamed protein product [Bemisia tabaci]
MDNKNPLKYVIINRKPILVRFQPTTSTQENESAPLIKKQPAPTITIRPATTGSTPENNDPPPPGQKKSEPAKKKPPSTDKDKWNPEQILELIMAVKEQPNLYDTKSETFHNRVKREESWSMVSKQVSLFKEGTTVDDVKAKWHSLRTQFAAEQKKVRESTGIGAAGGKKGYTPSMKFYHEIYFIK